MFMSQENARRKAEELVAKSGDRLTTEQRENLTKSVASQLERQYDKWIRDNVGLD